MFNTTSLASQFSAGLLALVISATVILASTSTIA